MSFTSALPAKLPLFGKRVISLTIAEPLGLLDAGASRAAVKPVSEGLGLLESAAKTLSRQVSESLGLLDVGATKSLARTIAESASLSESASKTLSRPLAEALGLYEYWAHVHPYLDPRIPLERLARILGATGPLEARVGRLLESPYIVYLLRTMAKRAGGGA